MKKTLVNLVNQYPDLFDRILEGEIGIPQFLFDQLYELYYQEMPYGTAKARTGDPYQWISEKIFAELGTLEIA